MGRKNSSNSAQKSKIKAAESEALNTNVLEDKAPDASKKKEPERKFAWTQNVKYRGKRYRANRPANILPGDIESLLEAKVIRIAVN